MHNFYADKLTTLSIHEHRC